jgi:peptide/nickel transport system permease protein
MEEVQSKGMESRRGDDPYALPRWRQRLAKFTRNLKGIFGMLVIAAVLICAIFSPLIAPRDPYTQSLETRLAPPVWEKGGQKGHLLGTDHLGRDVLSRLIYGSRVSVIVGFSAIFISGTIGVLLGLIAGYFSRFAGAVIMRIVDMFLSIPYVLMAIAVIAAIGTGLFNLILVLALTRWAHYARIMNATVIKIKEEEYIEAAHARGNSSLRIMIRQILPNAVPPILVLATLELAFMIIMEATLSFLGLGVQPPTPTWGLMSSEGREYITVAWWIITFSGLAIVFTVLGANLLGDWLRDILDPRLKV